MCYYSVDGGWFFLKRNSLVAAGFLFHAAIGFPSYLIDVIATRTTTVTSVLGHVLPVAAGIAYFKKEGYPEQSIFLAWLIWPAMIIIGYFCTVPELNVNLSHAVWPPLTKWVSQVWFSWMLNCSLAWALLQAANRFLKFSLRTWRCST